MSSKKSSQKQEKDAALLPVARTLPTHPSGANIATAEVSAETVRAEATDATSPPSIHAGDVLGERYRVLSELGRGAEGIVYRALDVRADAVVALKLLDRDVVRLERTRRELQMA